MEDATAWATYAASQQRTRRGWEYIAATLGRQLSTTPQHLSRVLYIPQHDNSTSHLPLYDVSMQYTQAVGDTPIGSSKYTVSLSMMNRPKGDGTDNIPVAYIVNFSSGSDQLVTGTVEHRGLPAADDVEVTMGTTDEEACSLKSNRAGLQSQPIAVGVSYPIPPSQTKIGTIKHPYFHFTLPLESHAARFAWQIHPVEHGPLRYTLVRMPVASGEGENRESEAKIEAIYHHIGLGVSLSQPHSEGILLLPLSTDSNTEALIVSSALGMLWQLRGLDGGKGNKGATAPVVKKSPFGAVKRLLKSKN